MAGQLIPKKTKNKDAADLITLLAASTAPPFFLMPWPCAHGSWSAEACYKGIVGSFAVCTFMAYRSIIHRGLWFRAAMMVNIVYAAYISYSWCFGTAEYVVLLSLIVLFQLVTLGIVVGKQTPVLHAFGAALVGIGSFRGGHFWQAIAAEGPTAERRLGAAEADDWTTRAIVIATFTILGMAAIGYLNVNHVASICNAVRGCVRRCTRKSSVVWPLEQERVEPNVIRAARQDFMVIVPSPHSAGPETQGFAEESRMGESAESLPVAGVTIVPDSMETDSSGSGVSYSSWLSWLSHTGLDSSRTDWLFAAFASEKYEVVASRLRNAARIGMPFRPRYFDMPRTPWPYRYPRAPKRASWNDVNNFKLVMRRGVVHARAGTYRWGDLPEESRDCIASMLGLFTMEDARKKVARRSLFNVFAIEG